MEPLAECHSRGTGRAGPQMASATKHTDCSGSAEDSISRAPINRQRSPTVIFNDIGRLYSLRSSLLHGGELREKGLLTTVRAMSTVPGDALFGVALSYVVARLRDLVRNVPLATSRPGRRGRSEEQCARIRGPTLVAR